MKRYIVLISILLLLSKATTAQKQYNVLDWKTDVTLNTWLIHQMKEQYAVRNQLFLKAVKSKKSAQQYIRSTRRVVDSILQPTVLKGNLNARITGTVARNGYRIEKLVFESFADHHVTSNLYIPDGAGKFPAVLFLCGHEDAAKATESYQKTAILLAQNGFVVLVVDPISQSERMQLTDKSGKPITRGGTTEHTLLNASSNLLGRSVPAYQLLDNMRAVDYLTTRSEIDSSRIGCLGNSGGAIQAIYLSAFDKRIKAVALSSYLATRERTFELTGAADGCAHIPSEGAYQLEMQDFLIASAPKPILALAGTYDFIDYHATLQAFGELKRLYTVLEQPLKAELFTYGDGHGLSKPKREAAASWFRRWLRNDTRKVVEDNVPTSTQKDLQVTVSGQVNTEYSNEINLNDFNNSIFNKFDSARKQALKRSRKLTLLTLQQLLSLSLDAREVQLEEKEQVGNSGYRFRKIIVRKHGETPLPMLLHFAPSAKKIVVWLHEAGKHKIADSSELVERYRREGTTVALVDVRGVGETKDKAEENDPKYFNDEYRNAMLALHIGKPLPGQRVTDILTVVDALALKSPIDVPIELHASGRLALPALIAPLFNEKISRVFLYNSIRTYKEVFENPAGKNWYSYVIPSILKYFDIPDLENLLGKGKVIQMN
jgi:dienelactone hydrolase